ncbi:MAG: hypothetical protein E4G95_01075 [Bacteroidia bacterium]|nr:MAG: hypothetical protein E4G95_01075 [Bacteroidia bacterium]
MKSFIVPFFLLLLVATSCRERSINILTYDLKNSDFTEKLEVTGTVQAVNNNTVVSPRNYYGSMSVAYIANTGSYVKKGDTVCILSSPQLISYYESFITSLENMEGDLKKMVAVNALDMSLLDAQLENTIVQLKLSSLDSLQMSFVPPVNRKILALEIEKASVERRKIEKKQSAKKVIYESELRQIELRIIQQQGRIEMLNTQIDALVIVAERDGIVLHTEIPEMMFMSSSGIGTIGGKIEAGSSVLSNMALLMLPDLSEMQISIGVSETDYKRIESGQKVNIIIDAVDNLSTTGRINRKTLVGKNLQSDSKVKTYEIVIDIDSCHLLMKPGLSASCEIIINEVKDTMLIPTMAIFERDSLKTVYVVDQDMFVPVIIETGESNSSFTIVSSGLKGNERIALSEPAYNLIQYDIKPEPDETSKSESESDYGKAIESKRKFFKR